MAQISCLKNPHCQFKHPPDLPILLIMGLSKKPVVGKRPFIVMAYCPDKQGIPRPKKPLKCPSSGDEKPCLIHIERWRFRVCGVPFNLAGMRCVIHAQSFTVYPPGWVPYARKLLALVDHIGGAVHIAKDLSPWRETVFEATLDASEKRLWPEEVQLGPLPEDGGRQPSRRTQRRHIAGAMGLLGLNTSQTTSDREIVGHLFQIGVSRLEMSAKKIRDGPTIIAKGVQGVRVLEQLPGIRLMISGLLTLGANQGYWGPALLH